jgi:membrane associated rhomboid family serine protease
MRQAAVGVQCPSCVSEGARSTRSGRTAYGGRRSSNPALTSQVLIGINALVWLLIVATGGSQSPWIARLALIPRGRCELADGSGRFLPGVGESQCAVTPDQLTWVPGVADGAWWQLVTSTFAHVQIWHVGFNMLALWFLGPQLEAAVGRARFLALYVVSGLAGSVMVYWFSNQHAATLGASGAIFGLMGALLVVAVKIKADPRQLLMWIGLNFVITVLGASFVSWQGHLGGFLGGVAIAAILLYSPRTQRALWQTIGIGVLVVLLLVLIAARTLALS